MRLLNAENDLKIEINRRNDMIQWINNNFKNNLPQ